MLKKILNIYYNLKWKGKASLFYAVYTEAFIQIFTIFV